MTLTPVMVTGRQVAMFRLKCKTWSLKLRYLEKEEVLTVHDPQKLNLPECSSFFYILSGCNASFVFLIAYHLIIFINTGY